MDRQLRLLVTWAALGCLGLTGCNHGLTTGKVGNTVNQPGPDGTCPAEKSLCGAGAWARCLDLQTDRENCGTCGNTCTTGIACVAGECLQHACTGPVSLSPVDPSAGTDGSPSVLPNGQLLADVNGDGRMDLVSWEYASGLTQPGNSFQVRLGQPGGGFGPPTSYTPSNRTQEITVGDYNGDGIADLYVGGTFDYNNPCVQVWLGHPDGVLTAAPATQVKGCLNTISVADLNGDGTTDVVTPDYMGGLRVFLADANAGLQASTKFPSTRQIFITYLLDWDGDGSPDIVATGLTLSLYFNRGDGSFMEAIECGVAMPWPEKVRIGDVNHDGHPDVVVGTESTITVMLNQGACRFLPAIEYPCGAKIRSFELGDLNGDGHPDLVATLENNTLSILLGSKDGTFHIESSNVPLSVSGPVLMGEVTGDTKPDILVTSTQGATQLLGNNCQ